MTNPDEKLRSALGALGGPAAAPDELAQAAREAMAQRPRARPWWLDAAVLLACNMALGVGASAMLAWTDSQHSSLASKYGLALGWLSVMALGSVWWMRPGAPHRRWLVGALFGSVSLMSLWGSSGVDPQTPFMSGAQCAFFECALALVPLCLVLLFSSQFAARASHVMVASLASASGGALALHFHCGNGTPSHVLAFHVVPAVVLGALATGLRWLLRPRTFAP